MSTACFAANEPKDADIIWTSMQVDEELKKAVGLTDDQYINQFPFEACLVMKHHLAETIQKVNSIRKACYIRLHLFVLWSQNITKTYISS